MGAAETAEARAAKPVAARGALEGEEIKRLGQGAARRWGEPADKACRQWGTGWYAGHHHGERGVAGEKDKPHPPLLCVRWGGDSQMAECR